MNINNIKGKFTSIKLQIIYINNQGYLDILPNHIIYGDSCNSGPITDSYNSDERYYNVIINM